MRGTGELLFVSGQIGWDGAEKLVSPAFLPQFSQALANVLEVVSEAGGGPTSIVRLVIYVTDKKAYLSQVKEVGEAYRARMGKHFPAMALLEVKSLLEDGAQVEIEAVALL
jgi:enamine deaminase RidA (YjgF/YER057c/UK114 family)